MMDEEKKTNRFYFAPAYTSPRCNRCKYYRGFGKCDAFPGGMPEEIWEREDTDIFCNEKNKIRFEEKE